MSDAGGSTETLRVDLGERGYDIVVGAGLVAEADRYIAPVLAQQRTVIVTDSHVAGHWLEPLQAALERGGIECASLVLEAGERTKDFAHLQHLAEALLDARVERKSTVIALGGGVIGDLTGFAAAITLRGIDFIQIPTTLLAQVDSSVGGKTGINTHHGKNLVGAFHQPRLVLADTATLDTLPERELHAGYAEVVKYGLIGDAAFFTWLETNGERVFAGDADARRDAVVTSCRAKAAVVAADERESGVRALLNFGHTFGHAFEAETGYGDRLLHGEGVAMGSVMAFELSARLGLCATDRAGRVRDHFERTGVPHDPRTIADESWTVDSLIGHMRQDKKVSNGRLTFVLARDIGDAIVVRDVDEAEVRAVLEDGLNRP